MKALGFEEDFPNSDLPGLVDADLQVLKGLKRPQHPQHYIFNMSVRLKRAVWCLSSHYWFVS